MTDKLELRKRWIEALRSGQYQQGRGRLKSKDGYCCLGVAAELAGERFLPSTTVTCDYYLPGEADHEMMISMLPDRVVKAYGLRDAMGTFFKTIGPSGLSSHKTVSLAAMNDKPYTFAEIADFIQQHPEQVFEADS